MTELKVGDLIVFKSHPYVDKLTEIKITAYSDYTSPILVIKQIKEKSHDKITGKDIAQELYCLYYSSRDGKFIERWISSSLVNKIYFSTLEHKFLNDIDFKKDLENLNKDNTARNYENLIKESYLNKVVVLKSVDVELEKKKVNRTKDNGELVETNHLEFLPPIMTIIGYKFIDDKNRFCERTGLPLIELKCKWYNSNSKTFSELVFPYSVLYRIGETHNLYSNKDLLSDINSSISENTYFNIELEKSFELEGETNVEIAKTVGYATAIMYKHYFYQMNYFDYITQDKSAVTIDQDFEKKSESEIFGKKYPNYQKGYISRVSNCRFEVGNYYFITYQDMSGKTSNRIIKVRNLLVYIKDLEEFKESYEELSSWDPDENYNLWDFKYDVNGMITISSDKVAIPNNLLPKSIFGDENVEMILNANCLLRKGKYRNFNMNRILEVTEIVEGQNLFEKEL